MPDDLSLIGLKRRFTLGVQGGDRVDIARRIRPALDDGIPKELEDIVVLQTVKPMTGTVLHLSKRGYAAPTKDQSRHKPYYECIPQRVI